MRDEDFDHGELVPFFYADGDAVWALPDGTISYTRIGKDPGKGWRRLYVAPLPKSDPIDRAKVKALAEEFAVSAVNDGQYFADQLRELLK